MQNPCQHHSFANSSQPFPRPVLSDLVSSSALCAVSSVSKSTKNSTTTSSATSLLTSSSMPMSLHAYTQLLPSADSSAVKVLWAHQRLYSFSNGNQLSSSSSPFLQSLSTTSCSIATPSALPQIRTNSSSTFQTEVSSALPPAAPSVTPPVATTSTPSGLDPSHARKSTQGGPSTPRVTKHQHIVAPQFPSSRPNVAASALLSQVVGPQILPLALILS
ncbi:unnamed protein product [Protopolystoma xenopodis]|uniref:Uncharacterized protein n=1 Tax=Protopolystoma xenopodis TaxID=117903 RepID=A0A3S5B161_9PLAT|nr:unnamed protein product [Protopolystoma xenopodis]